MKQFIDALQALMREHDVREISVTREGRIRGWLTTGESFECYDIQEVAEL